MAKTNKLVRELKSKEK